LVRVYDRRAHVARIGEPIAVLVVPAARGRQRVDRCVEANPAAPREHEP